MLSNSNYFNPIFRSGFTPGNHLMTVGVAFHISQAVRRRLNLDCLFRSSLTNISHLGDLRDQLKDMCEERVSQFIGFNRFKAFSMNFSFVSGDESGSDSKDSGEPQSPKRNLFEGRRLTTILLAANVLVYIAQLVSGGNVVYWGAKINEFISEGQLWRLATASFLHAHIAHLLVNCYSLNSVGPVVESICGPSRYLTVYMSSAIASTSMSYLLSKSPSVGASGAIFGLVGSFGMFVLRHRHILRGSDDELKHIGRVILQNVALGVLMKRIDSWGHFGGFISGAAVTWLLGPAWEVQSIAPDGRKIIEDKAPIFALIGKHPK